MQRAKVVAMLGAICAEPRSDWTLILDTDTYVQLPELRAFIARERLSASDPLYFG